MDTEATAALAILVMQLDLAQQRALIGLLIRKHKQAIGQQADRYDAENDRTDLHALLTHEAAILVSSGTRSQ